MGCSQVQHELLEHFALHEELGPRSWPHLAHLETCAGCRDEIGVDRELVRQLRRALRARVEGSAPSAAAWRHVRRRTVDRPAQPWTLRLVRWGGTLSAATVAAVMMFAVVTAPGTGLISSAESPFVASAARRALAPVDESSWPAAYVSPYRVPLAIPPMPGWPVNPQLSDPNSARDSEPPLTGRMR